MVLFTQFITVPVIRGYKIAEAVYNATANEFVLILFHPSEAYPAVHVKMRFLRCNDSTLVAFAATSLNDDFKIAGSAYEVLEFTMGVVVEEIYKCMYAKNVMTEI